MPPATKAPSAEVTIQGQRVALKVSSDDPERVSEILELVSTKIREAEGRARTGLAPHHVAVLALLDLAQEFVLVRQKTEDFKRRMSEKSDRLISLLEAELK